MFFFLNQELKKHFPPMYILKKEGLVYGVMKESLGEHESGDRDGLRDHIHFDMIIKLEVEI